jgi:hypothetical protein
MIQPENGGPHSERAGGRMSQSVNEQGVSGKTTDHCSAIGCARPDIVFLQQRPVCPTHFQLICYRQLEELSQNILVCSGNASTRESELDFTEECSKLANFLSHLGTRLPDEDRTRLLTIAFWAGELGRQLQQRV